MDRFPPANGSVVDLDDVKYVSRLSTILVATIEEAKDRISQIEYIFCSQLYPNVQSKYKSSQEVYLEAKRQAEGGWKEKEKQLVLRIQELERGKQEAIAENQSLKLEKEQWLVGLKRVEKLGVDSGKDRERIGFLEEQLAKKSAEVEEGLELSNRLIRMIQSKSTQIGEQSVQLKEQEEKANALVCKVEGLEKKVEDLMKEIGEKNEEIARREALFAEMEARIVCLDSEFVSEEKKVTEEEDERVMKLKKKIDELERNLEEKTREVERGRVLQEELQEQVGKQAHTIKVKMLREDFSWGEVERVRKELQEKMKGLEEKVNVLESDLNEKAGEVEKGRVLQEELKAKIREQDDRIKFEVVREEYVWGEVAKVRKELQDKINGLEVTIVELERNLKDKIGELERGRLLQEELQAKIREQGDRIVVEVVNKENVRSHFGKIKKELEDRIRVLEEKVKLQTNCSYRDDKEIKKLEELLKQIRAKDAELVGEKEKNKELVDAYKKLKHQYSYLCEKCGLTSETMLQQTKLKNGDDSLKRHKSLTTSPGTKDFGNPTFPHGIKKVKIEDGVNDGLDHTVSNPSFHIPPPRSAAQKLPPPGKSPSISGVKRPASGWIETRSGAGQGKTGPDPQDDFLSTPLENLRANKNKAIIKEDVEEAANNPDVAPAKTDVNPRSSADNDSDDETQNMNVDPGPAKQAQTLPVGKNGFKYVETVRKKAERENLKGVECKQCKKFYDAVLPENGGGGNNNENLRCEHHDGVSRHRYRYAPPMTPEGFWNIGFESEM